MKLKQPNSRHCFACGLENPIGLKLKFYQTAEDEVTAEFTAPEEYQGYPGILHGGVTATILDEAVGRAFMGIDPANSNFMYTAELKIRYKQKVPIGQPLKIVGKQVKRMRWTGESKAYMYDKDGNLLVEATAILVDLPDKMTADTVEELGWKIYPDE
jgi:uncharacterized protein (TIGR00369 family)